MVLGVYFWVSGEERALYCYIWGRQPRREGIHRTTTAYHQSVTRTHWPILRAPRAIDIIRTGQEGALRMLRRIQGVMRRSLGTLTQS